MPIRRGTLPAWIAVFSLLTSVGAWAWTPGTGSPAAIQGFKVDTTNRADVLSFFNTVYPASGNFAAEMDWTGNVANGVAGTTSATFKDDVRRRVNFYRALCSLPATITFDASHSSNDQLAALLASANMMITHTPATTEKYYTSGAALAAGSSNLFLGGFGADSIDGYMTDPGDNNAEVGHRRWILFTQEQVMGTGDVPATPGFLASNALWVLGDFNTAAKPQFVSWPNAGYCPVQLVPVRWSLAYPHADFTKAKVIMKQGSTTISCPITYTTSDATEGGSFVGDNTMVWNPTGLPTTITADTTYTVTVSGIADDRSANDSFTYTVTFFDPNVLGQTIKLAGPAKPPTTGATYTYNAISEADAYQLQVTTGTTVAWNEGAEDAPPPQIIQNTTGSYPLRQTALVHTGKKAFQLTFPHDVDAANNIQPYDFADQIFGIMRQIVPSSTSQLQFYQRGRFASTTTTLSAQVSTDNGNSWTSIWSRNGVGGNSADWDPSFILTKASLASYAGKVIVVRFVCSSNGNVAFLGTDDTYGFFIDDITVTNGTQLITPTVTTLKGSATSFTLNATTAGAALKAGSSYYLQVRPEVGLRWFGFSPYLLVKAVTAATGYAGWVSTQFPTVTGGAGGDFSNDGIPNGYKYAFGLDPTVHNSSTSIPIAVVSGTKLVLSYTAPSGITGVTYGAEWSTDLVTWTALKDAGSGTKHSFSVSLSGRPKIFLRNKLTFSP